MGDNIKHIADQKAALQKITLNKEAFDAKGGSRVVIQEREAGAESLQKTFDYIEKHTGKNQWLSTPMDTVNRNFAEAAYKEAKQKADDQGWWGEFGGFLAQTTSEVVLGAGVGMGYLLDIQHWGGKLTGGEGDWGNWMSNYLEKGQEWIREVAPIHQDPANAGRSTWENMLHGDGWWFSNGVSIASTLSIMLPVMGWARGVSLVGKGLNYAGQGARLGKAGLAATRSMKTVDKVMDVLPQVGVTGRAAIDGIHKATVSRLIESQMEATGVFKEKYEQYLSDPNMTEEEARAAASKAASFTYNLNWGAMVTDLPQYMLMGQSGKALKKYLNTQKPGLLTDSKFISKTAKARSVGTTMLLEGAEEAYQYIIAEEGKRMGDIQAGYIDPKKSSLGKRVDGYLQDAELQTSALFGALGGGVFAAAGPGVTNLINKAYRKGEMRMTEEDVRKNEARDRFTVLNHNLDLIKAATNSGSISAERAAKRNLAFEMAKNAVTANNWEQAREAISQLKNATAEEKETHELRDNFDAFVADIDESIKQMDVAADLVDKAKSKYTYGLAEMVARRQFDIHMNNEQSNKVTETIDRERRAVIPNYDKLSKDGNTALNFKAQILARENAAVALEERIAAGTIEADSIPGLEAQIAEMRATNEETLAQIKTIAEAGTLSTHDKLALDMVEGGSATSLVSAMAESVFLDLHTAQLARELKEITSREGIRSYKQAREELYQELKKNKAKEKEANKRAAAEEKARKKKGEPTTEISPEDTVVEEGTVGATKSLDDVNIAEVAKAVAAGASFSDFVEEEDVVTLKAAVSDYNARKENNPKYAEEELEDEEAVLGKDALTFSTTEEEATGEESTEGGNVLADETELETELDPELEVDPSADLNAELLAAETAEIPENDTTNSAVDEVEEKEKGKLANIPAQLAWLSANNPRAEEVTPEMIALSAFLETPDSAITDHQVTFEINKEFMEANASDPRMQRIQAALAKGEMPSKEDIGFVPISAVITKDGSPVVFRGVTLKMNLHDPSFFYNNYAKNTPKFAGVSEHQANTATLHKQAILRQMNAGGTVTARIDGKSDGKINTETGEDGKPAIKIIAQTLKTGIARLKFFVGTKQRNYTNSEGKPRLVLGKTATAGAIYVEVPTANGSKYPLRVNVASLSVEEATIIHSIYVDLLSDPSLVTAPIGDTGIFKYIKESTNPRIAGMLKYMPNLADMTYQEVLEHLVYEGTKTKSKPDRALLHYVNTTNAKGVAIPNSVNFGKSRMDVPGLESEAGKREFIEWLMANKLRQVDRHLLDNEEYKAYLNDNSVLSTDVATTPEGRIFIQPIISYSTKMAVTGKKTTETNALVNEIEESEEEVEESEEEVTTEATTTAEAALLALEQDLLVEQGEFGNPEIAAKIEADIAQVKKQIEAEKAKIEESTPVATEEVGKTDVVFDEELAAILQAKLENLYPEIKLTITATPQWQRSSKNIFNQEEYANQVNYRLKAVDILSSDKAKQVFEKAAKNKWTLDKTLSELQIPKEQKKIILGIEFESGYVSELDFRENIVVSLLADTSFAVEVNTAKEQASDYEMVDVTGEGDFEVREFVPHTEDEFILDENGDIIGLKPVLSEKGKKQIEDREASRTPTQHYSNLTVPGGTNYTENEISTPAIKPAITGHADFSTDNGIGWFRSDDTANNDLSKGEITKTRRILEVQSDLFQKGRDREDLINEEKEYQLDEYGNFPISPTKEEVENKLKNPQNQFLQLLNKDSNWVSFFVKSIVQDSAKQGYEKVVFPSGDTASKVEGHTTLEEFKTVKEARIKELEAKKNGRIVKVEYGQKTFGEFNSRYLLQPEGVTYETYYEDVNNLPSKDYYTVDYNFEKETNEINQLKQELKRVETEGFGALKPIYKFYENTVTNTLNKIYGKDNVKLITDEFGNTWNEVTITPEFLSEILLQRNEANKIIGQANIKAGTVLIDLLNQKQDTLPHEYAHHYIAFFRNTPIVQAAIAKWGSEEALVQSIGEQVVKQRGEAASWWSEFVNWIKASFDKLSKLEKQELTNILTDAFLQRQDLAALSSTVEKETPTGSKLQDAIDMSATIEEIIDNSNFIKLSEDGTTYVNTKTGKVYQRVTTFISDEEITQNALLKSSQIIGTKVDELLRDFFSNNLKPLEEYNLSDKENIAKLIEKLTIVRDNMIARNEIPLANDIVLYNDEIGVAGTVDLLTYDNKGNIRIYDFKTMRGDNFTSYYSGDTLNKYETIRYGKSKKQKHTEQLSLYRILLNNTHGVKATTIAVMPIEIGYNAGDVTTNSLNLLSGVKLDKLDKVKTAELLDKKPNEKETPTGPPLELKPKKVAPTVPKATATSPMASVKNTITMFQKGVVNEKGDTIKVNIPEDNEFPENPCK